LVLKSFARLNRFARLGSGKDGDMTKIARILLLVSLGFLLLLFAGARPAACKDDWPPIPPEELAMKDNPASPGSHAIVLYHEETDDHSDPTNIYEDVYTRIKIFTEQGKKYADIEIPFVKAFMHIRDVKARTVHPDGKITIFNGQVYEKTVVKYHDVKILVKSFTLPDVEPGSIIEYRYRNQWQSDYLPYVIWYLQEDLFMKRAVFSVRPYSGYSMHWAGRTMHGEQMKQDHGWYRLEVNNTPAFEEEDYMPPVDELKPHVEMYYSREGQETADKFWQRIGKGYYEWTESFIGKHGYVTSIANETVSPNDDPETKLRKLYARSQQIRNLSFEREKTEKEEKRDKTKENQNVEDVLKHGYGGGRQIDYTFAALARAAGFDAAIVDVARRDQVFFHRDLMNSIQLDDVVVAVRLGSGDIFLDPGTLFCPYGLLPWAETNTAGLRLDKNGGTFVTTTALKSSEGLIERKSALQLDSDGSLSGQLQVNFEGEQALRRRLDAREEDETGRRKGIEDDIKAWLPSGSKFTLTSVSGWEGTDKPLHAEGTLQLPGFATAAGHRMLIPVTIMQSSLFQSFQHANRNYPIYFHYPFEENDDITIQLPSGYQVKAVPPAAKMPGGGLDYQISASGQGQTIHVTRSFSVNGLLVSQQYYGALRNFFSAAKANDEQQAVLEPTQSANKN
jgi:hypothetical protein